MASRYRETFPKTTAEKLPKTIDYSDRLPDGASLSSCTVAAVILPAGSTANTVLSSTTATIAGDTASVFVLNGADGFRYEITFTATLSDTTKLVDRLLMLVSD